MASSLRPQYLYHWTSSPKLPSILKDGLRPLSSAIYLQVASDLEAATAYFNMPANPLRLTIDISSLPDLFSPDLSAWSDLLVANEDFDPWDSDHQGLSGTLDFPSAFDTLHYTGCICYRGRIPASAIVEVLALPWPEVPLSL